MAEKFYTAQELADTLKVTLRTVYNYLRAGHIKAIRCGRDYRIPEAEFNRILREGLHR